MSVSVVFRAGMLCFLGGTGIGLFFSWSIGVTFLVCSFLIIFVAVWFRNSFVWGIFLTLLLLMVFSGAWFRAAQEGRYWDSIPSLDTTLFRAEVVREPARKENSKQVTLSPISCSSSCPETRVLATLPLFSDVIEGDILSLSCPLERPERFSPDFDYPKILAKDGIGYVCRFPKKLEREAIGEGFFSTFVRTMRRGVESGVSRALPEPEAGLILGLLVGGDDRLPENIRNEFSRTGISHIVAVSGYNVSLVAILLMNLLIFFGLYRQNAFFGALLGVGFFTILVGAPPSAVRAAMMASVALFATRMGRFGNPVNAILFTACVMLFMNPLLLRYDIGFQLSFMATMGIFFLTPLAAFSLRAGDVVATTLSAEVFALPILLFHFHAIPTLSLFANMVILPMIPIAMFFGAFAALFGEIFSPIAVFFGFPAFLVSRAILFTVSWFSSFEFSLVNISNFGFFGIISWYGALFAAIFLFRRKFSHSL